MVSNKCCVPGCQESSKTKFGVPSNSLNTWEKFLGIVLTRHSRVCAKHFKSDAIVNTWVSGEGDSKYIVCLKKPRLQIGAVPTEYIMHIDSENVIDDTLNYSVQHDHSYYNINLSSENNFKFEEDKEYLEAKRMSTMVECVIEEVIVEQDSLFHSVYSQIDVLILPKRWFFDVSIDNDVPRAITFFILNTSDNRNIRYLEKQLVIDEDSEIIFYINGKILNPTDIGMTDYCKPWDFLSFQNIIHEFNKIGVCQGVSIKDVKYIGINMIESNGRWWHTNCLSIAVNKKRILCKRCRRLITTVNKKN